MKVELSKNEMEVLKELLGGLDSCEITSMLLKRKKYQPCTMEELLELKNEIHGVYDKVNGSLKELEDNKPFKLVTEKIIQVNGFDVVELSYNEISLDRCETKCVKKEYVFDKKTFEGIDSVLHYINTKLEWNKVYGIGDCNSIVWMTQIFENTTSLDKVNMYQLFLSNAKRGELKYYVSKDIKEIEKIISRENIKNQSIKSNHSEYVF